MKVGYIIVAVILFLLGVIWFMKYYIFRLGKAVDEKTSKSYYHHSVKDKIVYAPMGNWFELAYVELDADKDSFVPLAEEFGRDKNSIFWKGARQSVDFASFYIDNFVPKDKLHVYDPVDLYQDSLTIIKDADPKSFQRFDTKVESWDRYWYKDHRHYFYDGKKIEADYETFQRINQSLAIDTNHIYAIINKEIEDSVRSITFKGVINKATRMSGLVQSINANYAMIGNTVVLSNWKNEFESISFDKIESMREIDERNIVVNGVLISDGKIIPSVDIASFQILDRDYMKDKNLVFYDGKLIPDAHASTFEVLSEEYSKDRQKVFYKNNLLEGANAKDFKYDYPTNTGSDGNKKFKDGKLIGSK